MQRAQIDQVAALAEIIGKFGFVLPNQGNGLIPLLVPLSTSGCTPIAEASSNNLLSRTRHGRREGCPFPFTLDQRWSASGLDYRLCRAISFGRRFEVIVRFCGALAGQGFLRSSDSVLNLSFSHVLPRSPAWANNPSLATESDY